MSMRRAALAFCGVLLTLCLYSAYDKSLVPNASSSGPILKEISSTTTTETKLMAAASLGTSEIYAGGDPRAQRLSSARSQVNQALDLIRSGAALDSLCEASRCDSRTDSSLCHVLQLLNEGEKKQCKAFLIENASALLSLNTEEATPFQLSSIPLLVNDSHSKQHSVIALTKQESGGPIVFHHGSISPLPSSVLLALILHELGHKIRAKDKSFISDSHPYGTFTTGRRFLDVIGAALAVYAPTHVRVYQEPPPLPESVSLKSVCPLGRTLVDRVILGMLLESEKITPSVEELRRWSARFHSLTQQKELDAAWTLLAQSIAATDASRAALIRFYFVKFLSREPSKKETSLMLERMASGDTAEYIVASIAGDAEYVDVKGGRTSEHFLSSIYIDFLGRAPSREELATATEQLEIADKASWVLAFLKWSPVARQRIVESFYRLHLNRLPEEGEAVEAAERLAKGESWEIAKARVLASPEFVSLQQKRFKSCDGVRPSKHSVASVAGALDILK